MVSSLAAALQLGVAAVAAESRGVHAAPCDETREEQNFSYDSETGYISTTLDGEVYCAVVDGCGLRQDEPVTLVPCKDANSTCASWQLATPPHLAEDDAKWLLAPGSPLEEPRCLENPKRSGTVDIYCCSGTSDCTSTYPSAIPHQQWILPGKSKSLRLATGDCLEAASTPLTEVPVWPLPQKLSCTGKRSGTLLSSTLKVNLPQASGDIAAHAAQRYEALLQAVGSASGSVKAVEVTMKDTAEHLTLDTDYSYSLSLESSSQVLKVEVASPFGLGYALETMLQLQEKGCDQVELQDAPAFRHRGLMIDTGRRFYPISLVESLLEGMSMYKMNVLHFHVSEECFRIESKVYPSLHTANCTKKGKSNNEFYTQEDIKHIVDFAKLRGIRVIPEFDMPGHSGGFCMGLESEGIQCCGSQIADDSEGKSVALINSVLDEMMELFPDDVIHIGCDETGSSAPCTLENTKSFEEKVIQHLLSKKKTVMGWEEILFKTGAAEISQDVVVDAWEHSSWQQAAQAGHPVVDSENGHFYLDNLGRDHTAANMWLDITKGETNATTRSFLLGGEASMWQDQYVPNRPASCMFQSPERDGDFANSTSSMIWPRNAIAAGSFWRYSSQLSGTDDIFASVLARASSRLEARGVGSCHCTTPSSTGCQQQAYCGQAWCEEDEYIV